MSKFDEYFSEAQYLANDWLAVSAKIDKTKAALMISSEICRIVNADDLKPDRVMFGYPIRDFQKCQDLEPCWFICSHENKDSEEVWVYD